MIPQIYNRQQVQDEYVAHGTNRWVKLEDLPHGRFPREDDMAYFSASHPSNEDDSIKQRIVMERAVIRALCDELLEQGLKLRLHNGEEWSTEWTTDRGVIMQALMATDEERLRVSDAAGKIVGSAFFVYGNEGWSVIADNSVTLEDRMVKTNAFVDSLQG